MLGGPYGEITDPQTGEVVGRPDSELGATITGVTFLVMGVPALLIGLWSALRGLTNRGGERPTSGERSTSAGATGGMTTGAMGGCAREWTQDPGRRSRSARRGAAFAAPRLPVPSCPAAA